MKIVFFLTQTKILEKSIILKPRVKAIKNSIHHIDLD